MLEKKQKFPDFALQDQKNTTHSLTDYAGRWLVVYCYPKDNTSACTLEARDFSCMAAQFLDEGAHILGVSPDSVKSHAGFVEKQELSVTLLSDPEQTLLEATGAWQKKKLYGKEHMGVVRSTFLVGPDGVVREVWTKVKTPGHAEAVLDRLKALRREG
jgi:Peroxiredoxin